MFSQGLQTQGSWARGSGGPCMDMHVHYTQSTARVGYLQFEPSKYRRFQQVTTYSLPGCQ